MESHDGMDEDLHIIKSSLITQGDLNEIQILDIRPCCVLVDIQLPSGDLTHLTIYIQILLDPLEGWVYGITVLGKYYTIATIEAPSYFTLETFGSLVATIPVAVDTTESEFVFRKALIPSFRVHIPDEADEDEEDMFPTTREDSEKWKKVQDSEEYGITTFSNL
jgi:hypothetical protein